MFPKSIGNKYSGAMLIAKFRVSKCKYRYKIKLLKKSKTMLKTAREESDVYIKDEEKNYSQEQLFEALDLKFRSNIRYEKAKDKAWDLVAKRTMKLGISKPDDAATKSKIHNARVTPPQRPLNYSIEVTKSLITKLNDDLRRMRKRSLSSSEVPILEAKISIQGNQIKTMEDTIKD
ncbi:hypothetical protein Cgig2_008512 [Carnegiea gigantea]|uniref:Uncharacterized protein n=1 Tax=Carnegiea gigantea TaxID=171969 RepID=A0A9Q1JLC4_9CARY|nr:hypothetical protein Cgig2_008512 [Carnegiea gigantea]